MKTFVVILLIVLGIVVWKFSLLGALLAWLLATFALGAAGFWWLLGLAIGVAWFLEAASWKENWSAGWAVVPFAAYCAVIGVFNYQRLDVVWGYAGLIGRYALWYAAAGLAFTVLRWIIHILQKRGEFDKFAAGFTRKKGIKEPLAKQHPEVKREFARYLRDEGYRPDRQETRLHYDPVKDGVAPAVARNWRVVSCWFFWWFFELFRWIFGDLWSTIVRGVRAVLTHALDWMSNIWFGDRAKTVSE